MKTQNKSYHFEYHLDSTYKIIYVNRNWDIFALLNNASDLTKENVLNTSIYKYISGDETKHIFNVLFSEVKTKGVEKTFPFRCDSPAVRRFMEMSIINAPDNNIIIKTKIIKQERREEVSLLNDNVDRSGELIRMCSFCKKIYNNKDKWVEVEEAIRLLSLFDSEKLPQITHAYCNQCMAELLKHIRKKPKHQDT